MRRRLSKRKKKIHLVLAGTANPFERALSIAVRQIGGRTTTFIHGGDVGFRNVSISLDVTTADNFVVYTEKSAELFEAIKKDPAKCTSSTNIIAGETDEYFKLLKKYRTDLLPKDNKRVMIIGYPQNQWRRTLYIGGFSLARLDLELRLAETLHQAGYEVIYKAHPEKVSEIEGVFDSNVRLSRDYFEDVLDEADLFLFSTTTTTAFPIALCTNKPIVTLDLSFKLYEPFGDAMELFKKRCKVVSTEFDKRNRIVFNERELLDALAQRAELPNDEFLKTYYFPKDKVL